jgi:hypothetical protein
MQAGQCVISVGREFKFRALQTSASVFALGLTVARENGMAAYVIFDVGPSDRDALKPYLERAFDTLVPRGGKVIARTSNI